MDDACASTDHIYWPRITKICMSWVFFQRVIHIDSPLGHWSVRNSEQYHAVRDQNGAYQGKAWLLGEKIGRLQELIDPSTSSGRMLGIGYLP